MVSNTVELLREQPIAALIVIVALGSLVGRFSFRGVTLGPSGVLFVAMVFGHFRIVVPQAITTLGVVLFVYSIGLQAGPRFLKTIRRRGVSFVLLAAVTLMTGFGTTLVMASAFSISPAIATGIFAGSLTSTPGLAAALESLKDSNVSVGYGVAYPFGTIGVILFLQIAARRNKGEIERELAHANAEFDSPRLRRAWFAVKNPQLYGRSLGELAPMNLTAATVSRVVNKGRTYPARLDVTLEEGAYVRAVGSDVDLARLEFLVGPRCDDFDEPPSEVTAMTAVVTEDAFVGKSFAELQLAERYGINVSRVWRDDFEFVPNSRTRLEFGDSVRIVGAMADCQRLIASIGDQVKRLNETRFLPLSLGLLLGVILGSAPIGLPGGFTTTLGFAGGPLLAGLIAGHFGRIGNVSFRIPEAVKFFMRELGLILFLAGAGAGAGKEFLSVIRQEGIVLCLIALACTLIPMCVALLVSRMILGLDVLVSLGGICGAMTSTPGLGVLRQTTDSEISSLAYVAVYPTALIGVTILAPLLASLLTRL